MRPGFFRFLCQRCAGHFRTREPSPLCPACHHAQLDHGIRGSQTIGQVSGS